MEQKILLLSASISKSAPFINYNERIGEFLRIFYLVGNLRKEHFREMQNLLKLGSFLEIFERDSIHGRLVNSDFTYYM